MAEGENEDNALLKLLALYQMPKLEGLWYHQQDVKIDGYHFVSCRFDACRLHVGSSNFRLERCIIDDKTVIHYGSDPAKIIKLFVTRWSWLTENFSSLSPVRHPDGTFSIL